MEANWCPRRWMQKPVSLPTTSTSSSSCTPAQPEEIFGLPKAESLTRSFFFSLSFYFFLLYFINFSWERDKMRRHFFVVLNRIRKKWKCTPCWSAQHPPASLAPYTHTGKQQLVNQFYPANPEPIKWKVSSLYRYRSIQRVFPLQSLARAYKRLSARARVLASAHDWSAMRNAARNGGGYYTPGHIHACITLKVYPSPLPFLSPPSPPPP